MAYDPNGNIQSLTRANLDQLTYSYAQGNKLLAVSDASANTQGFADGNTSGNDYDYWADGSLKKDLNRGISQIDYNLIKLPKKISFTNGKVVSYQYDANGRKLQMSSSTGQIRDYFTGYEKLNGQFDFLHTPEGRAYSPGTYEYFYQDHLGNIRAVFRDSAGIATLSQRTDYDPWGLELTALSYQINANTNRLKFNGKESLAEVGSGLLDYGARLYDATIGRWGVVDPLAEVSRRFSPFVYGNNNPVRFIDPDGMEATDQQKQGFEYSDGYSTQNSRNSTGSVTFEGTYQTSGDGPGKGSTNTPTTTITPTAVNQQNYANFQKQTKGLGADLVDNLTEIGKALLGIEDQDPNCPTKAMVPMPFFMGGGNGASKIVTLAEANAGRQLAAMEAATNGAHFVSRHGAGTTLAQQETRALTGLTPDGLSRRAVDASRFLSNQIQLQAVQRAQTIFNQTGQNVINFNMGFSVGEGYLKGGSAVIQSTNVQAIFRGGSLYTMFPKLR